MRARFIGENRIVRLDRRAFMLGQYVSGLSRRPHYRINVFFKPFGFYWVFKIPFTQQAVKIAFRRSYFYMRFWNIDPSRVVIQPVTAGHIFVMNHDDEVVDKIEVVAGCGPA